MTTLTRIEVLITIDELVFTDGTSAFGATRTLKGIDSDPFLTITKDECDKLARQHADHLMDCTAAKHGKTIDVSKPCNYKWKLIPVALTN